MSIEALNNNLTSSVYKSAKSENSQDADTKSKAQDSKSEDAYVFEKSDGKSSVYNEKALSKMLSESDLKTQNFKALIEKVLNQQTTKFYQAFPKELINEKALSGNLKGFFSSLEVDEETRLQAQKDISEDGYYGVKKTSERILDFAKAIAGSDPQKLEEMYAAVKQGFKIAEKMWGDELPEISKQTFNAVEKGFDAWRKEISGTAE